MKKVTKILVPFLCLISGVFSGCKNKPESDGKILLSFGDMHATDVTELSHGDIADKVNNRESFMLAISSNTCACWLDFHPIIKTYVTENHLFCAHTTYNGFKDYASTYGIVLTPSTTTFVIFKSGEAKIKLMSDAADKTMKDLNSFRKFMEGNIKLPKMYLINEEDIASINASGKNAVVYYERTKCGDCTYLNPSLFEYFQNHYNSNNLYVLDCQPWKSLSDEEYQAKKDNFGLSTKNNPVYGYDTGVFPYFSYLSNGKIKSAAVAFNDTISKIDGKYIITNSYYTNERIANLDYTDKIIKGMELSADDVADNGEYIMWMQDKAIKEYKPIITNFLDSKLANVNFSF